MSADHHGPQRLAASECPPLLDAFARGQTRRAYTLLDAGVDPLRPPGQARVASAGGAPVRPPVPAAA